ncbi:MAG: HNH endonuclease [Chloroflexota bacterium]
MQTKRTTPLGNSGPDPIPADIRMWRHVGRTDDLSGCWLYQGGLSDNGYGLININGRINRKPRRVHCLAWEQASGEPIPPGYDVCHACDVRNCVRNDARGVYEVDGVVYPRWGHLYLAPRQANMRDAVSKGRLSRGEARRQIMRTVAARGERAGNVKLTEDQVREMRELRAQGTKLRILSEYYGVSEGNISMICRRLKWAHVV